MKLLLPDTIRLDLDLPDGVTPVGYAVDRPVPRRLGDGERADLVAQFGQRPAARRGIAEHRR